MGRLLFLLFALVPLVEIAFFVVIGGAIGLWPTLLGVLLTALLGAWLVRTQGLSLVNEIRQTMSAGRLPARAMADTMMVGLAGLLLLTPGYFTDLLGILLLIPPVRTLIYRAAASRMSRYAVTVPRADPRRPPDDGTIDLDSDAWRPR